MMEHLEVGTPADLAQRIQFERACRGWSMGHLVDELKRVGVTIPRSAVKRIEDGEREVKALELARLAQVFETSMSDMLRPMGLFTKQRLSERIQELKHAMGELTTTANTLVQAWQAFYEVAYEDEDQAEWVFNQLGPALARVRSEGSLSDSLRTIWDHDETAGVAMALWVKCMQLGEELAGPALKRPRRQGGPDGQH